MSKMPKYFYIYFGLALLGGGGESSPLLSSYFSIILISCGLLDVMCNCCLGKHWL